MSAYPQVRLRSGTMKYQATAASQPEDITTATAENVRDFAAAQKRHATARAVA